MWVLGSVSDLIINNHKFQEKNYFKIMEKIMQGGNDQIGNV